MPGGNAMSIFGQYIAGARAVKYVGSAGDVLTAGQVVCYDHDNATVNRQESYVETPTFANAKWIAGIVANDYVANANGVVQIDIIPFSMGISLPGIPVLTDQTVLAGDILGVQPGTRNLRRGYFFGPAVLRVNNAATGTVAAPVLTYGTLHPIISVEEKQARQLDYFNDFHFYTTVHNGLTTIANTTAGTNAVNGVASGSCAATTDNSPGGTKTTQQLVTFASGNAAYFGAKFLLTEADVTLANWLLGFQDKAGTTTTTLGDDGAGPVASIDMAAFYKLDNSMFFRAGISRTTAQSLNTLTTAFASATDYIVEILYNGLPITSGGGGRVLFAVNGTLVSTLGGVAAGDELKIPSGIMYPTMLVKSGSATGTQTIALDWVRFAQAKT